MIEIEDDLYQDLEAVRQIPIVPTMLEVICHTTGMGFAAIARVTQDRWVACSVRDEVQFGLKEGGELEIATTLCNEIRDSREPVFFDHATEDQIYCNHHTPRLYGLQSYISFPIILKDGTFFGTLCAIDAKPANINNQKVIGMFKMFAELLAFHLQSQDLLDRTQQANLKLKNENRLLANSNFDLDNFVYTASHDLKSPLHNLEGLITVISAAVDKEDLNRKEIKQITGYMQTSLRRLTTTVNDLTTIVQIDKNGEEEETEPINIFEIVETVRQDLDALIVATKAKIEVSSEENLQIGFSKKNMKSILYNLLSNAIKYRSPDRPPEVRVAMEKVQDKIKLTVTDNGSGIPSEKKDTVFTIFKRLHDHVEGSGLGLYIVKRMVDKANGQIKVSSTLNQGTTFTIIL
ncbi:GAF domain-containing sensor histidine kinase [Pontibacter sp. 13R65]|uniref:sensor histidine kinase n=1 Tax=Pontibacter sp. 13R65 TaxID=3127458 RepID=UPI00301C535D